MICSSTRVFFVTLFCRSQDKQDTIQTMGYFKSASSYRAAKYSSVRYIIANSTSAFTTFWGTYFSF